MAFGLSEGPVVIFVSPQSVGVPGYLFHRGWTAISVIFQTAEPAKTEISKTGVAADECKESRRTLRVPIGVGPVVKTVPRECMKVFSHAT